MTNTRGIYFIDEPTTTFLPALKISAAINTLSATLEFSPEKVEKLTAELYNLVANYDITKKYCWLKLSKTENTHYFLGWGMSPVIKSLSLSNEAIAAVYYVWKQSRCTPEEACKVLNVSMQDLMDLSAQFDNTSL